MSEPETNTRQPRNWWLIASQILTVISVAAFASIVYATERTRTDLAWIVIPGVAAVVCYLRSRPDDD
jgi:hypothetical protein